MNGESLSLQVESTGPDALELFRRQLLVEACLAVAGDMESYDYQIGRLIRKVEQALVDNVAWAHDRRQLLNLVRYAAAGFGGRRETVWLASFDSSQDPEMPFQSEA
jgi:hypothetical protein